MKWYPKASLSTISVIDLFKLEICFNLDRPSKKKLSMLLGMSKIWQWLPIRLYLHRWSLYLKQGLQMTSFNLSESSRVKCVTYARWSSDVPLAFIVVSNEDPLSQKATIENWVRVILRRTMFIGINWEE